MVKRKREETAKDRQGLKQATKVAKSTTSEETPAATTTDFPAVTLQIITGSYERVLHGFTAAVSPEAFAKPSNTAIETSNASELVQFVDNFLFEAHTSAIRCLALSPLPKADSNEAPQVILATGATDERVNLYSLSAAPVAVNEEYPTVPTLAGNKILENPKNRELGSLMHHSAPISALCFPSRSKILVGAEDNTISVTKTRDFTVVSTIKAPHPKVQGRPSGDTAPPGGSPSGINDFAVHPSMKLMLSVGKGEKCMRLWNLVTGKKAGVLSFNREILQSVKEGKYSTGEGRRIVWNFKGDEFAVAFEWGAVVFGIDSTPICRVFPNPRSKIHQMTYVSSDPSSEDTDELLAVSTEDGRVIFYSTKQIESAPEGDESPIPFAKVVAQLGGRAHGFPGRVKDFEVLSLKDQPGPNKGDYLVVTANSAGLIRVWLLRGTELVAKKKKGDKKKNSDSKDEKAPEVNQVGRLLNTYATGNRITCLKAFVMLTAEDSSDLEFDDEESEDAEEVSEEESDSEASDDE
ncbi:60S ribosome biogenesis protein Mak11 [Aspergillus japonicus CBS 114.51]|uniref:60S ribosome biogenesis protein Mak11 n=1 Tax=Aspergillus japonicus CBS 114.51 TaxID=1448312 RepID=A0A8T8X3Y4_ASPJA|nr:60S ribosome biogenesis protein Mak11 [Aspergillus japonicus CBS 114.51]RAH82664.1 60S ribosome biogenesis protein Mak11 [Aspergillus japonicus CBS 114.51]